MALPFKYFRTARLALIFLCLGLLVLAWNVHELWSLHSQELNYPCHLHPAQGTEGTEKKLTYAVHGKNVDSGYLKHVHLVIGNLGFERQPLETPGWDLLWSHDYPFKTLKSKMLNLEPHQKVNHFPGSGYITNKRTLALSNHSFVPKSFRIPEDKIAYLDYVKKDPNATFVQKNGSHRGVQFLFPGQPLPDTQEVYFVQEYVNNPYLIDGHKFDIGVYVIVTSIQPLRVYAYYGDILLRFCPHKYHPFDPADKDKYVVGDDYLPPWQVPSIKRYMDSGYNAKSAITGYLWHEGLNPDKMFEDMHRSIRDVFLSKEAALIEAGLSYPSLRNFFELMRFDFVVDHELRSYLMEANMSPNLSSAHFSRNKQLYESVLFNALSLVGLANHMKPSPGNWGEPRVSSSNLAVFSSRCVEGCPRCGSSPECNLCQECLGKEQEAALSEAYREHMEKRQCHRLFPPPVSKEDAATHLSMKGLNVENKELYLWYQGKCQVDESWCGP